MGAGDGYGEESSAVARATKEGGAAPSAAKVAAAERRMVVTHLCQMVLEMASASRSLPRTLQIHVSFFSGRTLWMMESHRFSFVAVAMHSLTSAGRSVLGSHTIYAGPEPKVCSVAYGVFRLTSFEPYWQASRALGLFASP